ncbi:hypothetical protein GGI35DRAFT_490820 [Trichoderma velutinum]
MKVSSESHYAALKSETDKEELDRFIESPEPAPDEHHHHLADSKWVPRKCLMNVFPWLLNVALALLLLLLFYERFNRSTSFGSYESGFNSDISISHIPLEQIRFRGSPQFSINGTGSLEPMDNTARWPENMKLFGVPSTELDENWERLIGNRYFSVSEEEAEKAWGEKRFDYVDELDGGYTAG